ncbi:CBS domain-containing protein [Octadecabacter sp. SW4]|uniref:CBS domain-containing protein n=1 Tax=Octadecabacter sp. SW4 TaxID=2602067 RepID=UPI0011C204C9|nr:CBS domain-containing protein [Octadecabacter sp. SW4]QEE36076.1 CBS domain-containing protein [Octadecabacter sp. SW4]
MTQYRVAEILRDDGPILTPDMPIRRAATLLVQARAAAAVVIGEDGRLDGILTQKDCFKPALHASYYQEWTGRVADQMSRNVISVNLSDDVVAVAERYLRCPHRVFPVMDGPKVAGLVHRSDVLALLLRIG